MIGKGGLAAIGVGVGVGKPYQVIDGFGADGQDEVAGKLDEEDGDEEGDHGL